MDAMKTDPLNAKFYVLGIDLNDLIQTSKQTNFWTLDFYKLGVLLHYVGRVPLRMWIWELLYWSGKTNWHRKGQVEKFCQALGIKH